MFWNKLDWNKRVIKCHFYKLVFYINNTGGKLNRIKYNPDYIETVDIIWRHIYSNIELPYNGNYIDFIPLIANEIKYLLKIK